MYTGFAFALVASFCAVINCESCIASGVVRLVWGSGNWEGNIQVCLNGTWGWICGNNFNTADGQVICNQLGYSTSGVVVKTDSYFGFGRNGTMWMDDISCTGTESSLLNCGYSTVINNTCTYDTLAGVICQSGGSCTDNSVRLITASSTVRSYGRVEVCISNQWGSVCDDGWDSYDARATCKSLGFYGIDKFLCKAYAPNN
jgi:deleted-in-malignant-brain-tumors protein 1